MLVVLIGDSFACVSVLDCVVLFPPLGGASVVFSV